MHSSQSKLRLPLRLATAAPLFLAGCLSVGNVGAFQGTSSGVSSGSPSSSTGGSATGTPLGTSGGTTGTTGGLLPSGSPCGRDPACQSGVCGVDGGGRCCASRCGLNNPPCGATSCDASGACVYPDATVSCGQPPFCSGSVLTTPSSCDGQGSCQGEVDCAPFVCSVSGCSTSCLDNAGCAAGFCDVERGACCDGLTSAASLAVDSVLGDDSVACCGYGGTGPCQTLAHAMQLVDGARAAGLTLHATVDGGSGDWAPPHEMYPIVLGWDVELSAPGVFFLDPGGPQGEIFAIAKYSARDTTGTASIVGSATDPVGIGMDRTDTIQTAAHSAIEVEANQTLYLANATVNAKSGGSSLQNAITVAAKGALMLAQDRSGAVTGTVRIGTPTTKGGNGIVCQGDETEGCRISDAPLTGESSVVIQNQTGRDIDAEDHAVVSLSSTPVIGVAPAATGFLQCPSKIDGSVQMFIEPAAIHAVGSASLAISNATIQCIFGFAFLLEEAVGTPTLTLSNSIIQNVGFIGIEVRSDTTDVAITVSNSVLRYNFQAIVTPGSVMDLSGGSLGGRNTIVCSNSAEGPLNYGEPGIGVQVFSSSGVLKATNVDWDTPGPDVFGCDLPTCPCLNTTCTLDAGAEGMDIIADPGSIDTAGNGVAPYDCTVPARPDAGS